MPRQADESLNLGYVIDNSLQQLAKLGFLACIIAWCFTLTSHSLLLNLPLAIALIVLALWCSTHLHIQTTGAAKKKRRGAAEPAEAGSEVPLRAVPPTPFASLPDGIPGGASKGGRKWREQVASPVVESAWETLCGSIIQEFIYDMWYGALTPDKEFPREVRRVLNTAFGELAARARKTDLKGMLLRDVSELVMDQIELYRDTKESIMRGREPEVWEGMPQRARDRALLAELKAEKNLHPALYPPEDSPAILGHYKVIHTISEGIVAFLMERGDHAKVMMRSVARELLATCVLRALMGQITPYNINKLLLHSLQKSVERAPLDVEEVAAAAEARSIAKPDAREGTWDFTERVRQSLQEEEGLLAARSSKTSLAKRPKAHSSLEKGTAEPPASSEKKEARIKRVMSDNSMHPQPSTQGEAGDPHRLKEKQRSAEPLPRRPKAQPPAAPGSAEGDPRGDMAASTSGQLPISQQREGDAGNVMGMPASSARWRSKGGFIGRPRARVVAAELNTEGSKDVVIYKIRVADSTGEWTVSRRFRNFESLQRTLKELPGYRLRMPAKRVFTHSQSVGFVEERRQQLDHYLQQILADDALTGRMEVWEFLSAWSDVYGLDCNQTLLGTINASLKDANVNMRRAMVDIADDLEAKRQRANASLSKLASTNLPKSALGTFAELDSMRRNSQQSLTNGSSDNLLALRGGGTAYAGERSSPSAPSIKLLGNDITNLASSLFSKPKEESASPAPAAEPPSGSAAKKEEFRGSILHYSYEPPPSPGGGAGSATSSNQGDISAATPDPTPPSQAAAAPDLPAPRQDGATAAATPPPLGPAKAAAARRMHHQRSSSDPMGPSKPPQPPQPPQATDQASTPRSPAVQPPPKAGGEEPPKSEASKPRPAAADSGHIQLGGGKAPSPMAATQSMEAVPPAMISSSLAQAMDDRGDISGSALEEAAGISAPLYDVVDVLFQLQSRGFFRRQVYGVARQMLSLVAGGAIDEYILSQLRALRQEHQLARLIHSLQIMLWPGGLWFQRHPGKQPPPSDPPPPRFVMSPDNYLRIDGPAPLDADEIKEAVRDLLLASGPPALIRVIGRTAYQAGTKDLFDMIQSDTFVQQLGYGLVKIVLVNLMPELRPLFRTIERSPLDSISSKQGSATS